MRKLTLGSAALGVAALLALTGCAADDGPSDGPTTGTSTTDTSDQVPDVVGQDLDVAYTTLEDAGFTVESEDSTGQGRRIMVRSNWIVTSQEQDGKTVTLGAEKHTDGSSAPDEPAEEPSLATAKQACDDRGEAEYRYGWKAHWIMDLMADTYDAAAGTRFLKVGVTVTNMYNAKMDVVLECTVAGTDAAPQVTSFLVY